MPFSKITLEEDEAIKRLSSRAETPKRFKWEEALSGDDENKQNVRLSSGEGERTIGLTEIANTVGNALANLLLSKGEEDVFTNENRDFVAKVTRAVGNRFNQRALGQAENGGLSENEFHRGIEPE